jgi:hypothetical protein
MPVKVAYPQELITVQTYLNSSFEMSEQFRAWVLGLRPEGDNENGPDTWAWVRDNNAEVRDLVGDRNAPPYGTYLFIYGAPGIRPQILATGSFFPDDRRVAEHLGLKEDPEYLGILGFLQVHRDFRHGGLGTQVAQYRDKLIENWVNQQDSPKVVYLFTNTPHNVRIVERLGFVLQEQVVPMADGDELLYRKRYVPTAG